MSGVLVPLPSSPRKFYLSSVHLGIAFRDLRGYRMSSNDTIADLAAIVAGVQAHPSENPLVEELNPSINLAKVYAEIEHKHLLPPTSFSDQWLSVHQVWDIPY